MAIRAACSLIREGRNPSGRSARSHISGSIDIRSVLLLAFLQAPSQSVCPVPDQESDPISLSGKSAADRNPFSALAKSSPGGPFIQGASSAVVPEIVGLRLGPALSAQ